MLQHLPQAKKLGNEFMSLNEINYATGTRNSPSPAPTSAASTRRRQLPRPNPSMHILQFPTLPDSSSHAPSLPVPAEGSRCEALCAPGLRAGPPTLSGDVLSRCCSEALSALRRASCRSDAGESGDAAGDEGDIQHLRDLQALARAAVAAALQGDLAVDVTKDGGAAAMRPAAYCAAPSAFAGRDFQAVAETPAAATATQQSVGPASVQTRQQLQVLMTPAHAKRMTLLKKQAEAGDQQPCKGANDGCVGSPAKLVEGGPCAGCGVTAAPVFFCNHPTSASTLCNACGVHVFRQAGRLRQAGGAAGGHETGGVVEAETAAAAAAANGGASRQGQSSSIIPAARQHQQVPQMQQEQQARVMTNKRQKVQADGAAAAPASPAPPALAAPDASGPVQLGHRRKPRQPSCSHTQ